MASSVFEGDVKKNLLERTEAEKVFRPWWDTLEDYLLNILIVLGQPSLTFNIFTFSLKVSIFMSTVFSFRFCHLERKTASCTRAMANVDRRFCETKI